MVFLLYNKDMYESPTFKIIEKKDPFELRLYESFHTIAVHEPSLQGYSGFGYLFNYISGNNQSGKKMKMTVPVINDLDPSEKSMEFVIPKIHHQDIPQPMESQMKVKDYPQQYVLVYSFSGFVPKEKMETILEKMDSFLINHHMEKTGAPKIARYNGPYTLPFLRHNEIWLSVKPIGNPGKSHKA
jgi:hypothetical protein